MRRVSLLAIVLAVGFVGPVAVGQPPAGESSYTPKVEPASDEGRNAIRAFRVPAGLKVDLFAAEPMVANPIAFGVDEKNRFYVAETFRLHQGVTDTRKHMYWLDDDLASRTVADRVAMYRRHLGAKAEEYGIEHDRIRRVEDTDGDGRADKATVFADGFRDLATGLGSGVLARGGNVYYTCIPDLWLLRDADGDGRADARKALHTGYGVHVGFLGHDLHGLAMGPDGRLYFSIGDRGLNVTTKEGTILHPDAGAVLRCEPDGSKLEVFATGLRNPQELAFDQYGNLFTVDNNSDGGDQARLVHIVEGGDSGWRIGYQFIESPNGRGPWNSERLWRPAPANTAAYLLPPLANISDGPSGLAYHPGTSLLPERYRDHFFLCDFRGAAVQSGVRTFAVKPRGASFELADPDQFVWGLQATDIDFGTDGALYIADWVEGWGVTGKGRIYKVFDPSRTGDEAATQVKTLLTEGMERRPVDELGTLLGHADMRVRREAQFALVKRGKAALPIFRQTLQSEHPITRLHAIWGLGQLQRANPSILGADDLLSHRDDPDESVRAAVLNLLGESAPGRGDEGPRISRMLIQHLQDSSPQVRFQAALALGRRKDASALDALVSLLRDNGDRDPYLRHAGVMGLAGIGDVPALVKVAGDASSSVRLGALLALRRLGSPEVARFLDDPDPKLVLEAARAINDAPIEAALPRLAARAIGANQSEPVARRVLNANLRLGTPEAARVVASVAGRKDSPTALRVEALEILGTWEKPSGRDRIVGVWRPLPDRPRGPAAEAATPVVTQVLRDAPEPVRRAAAKTAARLALRQVAPVLASLVADAELFGATRVEALKALEALDADQLRPSVRLAVADKNPALRTEGLRLLARLDPAAAVPVLESVLETGTMLERQGAFATLGAMTDPAADAVLSRWLDRLQAGDVPIEARLDLLEAAGRRSSDEIRRKLDRHEAARPKDDPLAPYRESIAGGNAARGRAVFREKAELSCLRCHKVNGQGGEVGPDLTGIGGKQSRDYLLEAIVAPNAKIAQGFESVVVATADGQVHAGVLKGEDAETLRLMTPEAKLVVVPKADIEERKTGASAMPEDLLKQLSRSELRDLVEYLVGLR